MQMRINRSAVAVALVASLGNGSVAYAQRADARRVGVSRAQSSPVDSVAREAARDTVDAVVAKEVRSGPPIAIGAIVGALIGVVYTIASVNSCETQPSGNNDMKGFCGIGYVVIGPAAAGGGALVGGFVGWLVARSQR
jgi:hypothetical protein